MLQKAGEVRNTNIEAEGLERIQLAVIASCDDKGINTTSLAKNLCKIIGLTDTDNKAITENTEIVLPKTFKYNSKEYSINEDGSVKKKYKVYLYNNGDKCIDLTGGWTNGGEVLNRNGAIDNNTYLTVGVDNAQIGYGTGWHTINKIDTTGYNYLCLKYNVTGNSDNDRFGCCSGFTNNYGWKDNPTFVFGIKIPYIDINNNIIKIDLTSVERQGDFYVYITNRRTTNIYESWLE